jgi:hypothetical protein
MSNLRKCENGHYYPARFDGCPQCHADAVPAPAARLTVAEHIARLSDAELRSRDNIHWQGGTAATRALYEAEEKRRGIRR